MKAPVMRPDCSAHRKSMVCAISSAAPRSFLVVSASEFGTLGLEGSRRVEAINGRKPKAAAVCGRVFWRVPYSPG
eukprot:6196442-Pleurochrysis_carterae.AAC.1